MLTLFFAPGSSSMAPHIALHEVGAAFESRPLSLLKKEQRAPEYLALNPEGKVPTLLVDRRPLTEVAAILFYLAKRFPAAGLLPASDIEAESHVIAWMSFLASSVHPARAKGPEHARSVFRLVDGRLGGGPWALPSYSIADIHLFRLYWRYRGAMHFEAAEFPNLSAHYDRMMARPAVKRTIEVESAIGYELPQ
jgi:glutathione S-transferase